jgi:hypothetical protein
MDWTHIVITILAAASILTPVAAFIQAQAHYRLLVEQLAQNQRYVADQTRHIAQSVAHVAEIAARNEELTRGVLLRLAGPAAH